MNTKGDILMTSQNHVIFADVITLLFSTQM